MTARKQTIDLIDFIINGDKYCRDIDDVILYLKRIQNKAKKLKLYFTEYKE